VSQARPTIRCAVYTRKSSEEGLEQSFNSLHAQREACEAFILSQRHEGWQLLPAQYDDGGLSGGNMERPGLKKLLDDIASKKIDTVVVYKVDRLTRALSDFARIVETFDKQGVSFVSVTQQFNTTTSMGRLTLNVLLSFAQFEREVTGERIRDKVAASKKKGMWMGGPVPLGYDLGDRALIVNESEAKQVREIFDQYLRFGSVFDLYEHLKSTSIRSKARVGPTGRVGGGAVLSRGTLYHLLSNPLYIGKIAHKGVLHPGVHAAIISDDVWQRTVDLLKQNRVRRTKSKNQSSDRLLLGILFDRDGNRFTPTHASKKGRRYSYYISRTATERKKTNRIQRIPATEIEQVVASRVRSLLSSQVELSQCFPSLSIHEMRLLLAAGRHRGELLADLTLPEAQNVLRSVLKRVVVGESDAQIEVDRNRLRYELLGRQAVAQDGNHSESVRLVCPFTIKKRGQQVRIVISAGDMNGSKPVPSLMKAVARSRDWVEQIISGKARTVDDLVETSGLTKSYVKRTFRCAVLSPRLVGAILNGRHPIGLTVAGLTDHLPFEWSEQQLGATSQQNGSGLHGQNERN
jgi:DNA invertase Pin-like site-specific DNA recombinase